MKDKFQINIFTFFEEIFLLFFLKKTLTSCFWNMFVQWKILRISNKKRAFKIKNAFLTLNKTRIKREAMENFRNIKCWWKNWFNLFSLLFFFFFQTVFPFLFVLFSFSFAVSNFLFLFFSFSYLFFLLLSSLTFDFIIFTTLLSFSSFSFWKSDKRNMLLC
jgi:hypothetical protein